MIARTLRGLAALAALAALLLGWPAALIALAGAAGPWLPDLSDPAGLLARPDTGGLFLLIVLLLGAGAWLVWSAALLAEAAAQVRGVPTPRLGGLFPQRSAAALVTAVAVAFAAPAPFAAALTAPAPPPAPAAATAMAGSTPSTLPDGPPATGPVPPRTYTVQPGDTLWDIADQELADPYRWPDIAAASDDLPQPDGRELSDPDLIRPGWTVHLTPGPTDPAPAHPVDEPAPASPAPTGSTTPDDPAGGPAPTGSTTPDPQPLPPRTPLAPPNAPAPAQEPAAQPASPGTAPTADPAPAGPARPAEPGQTAAGPPGPPRTPPTDPPPAGTPVPLTLSSTGFDGGFELPLTPTRAADAPDLAAAVNAAWSTP